MQHPTTARTALSRRNVLRHGVLAAAIAVAGAQPAFAQTMTKGTTVQLTQDGTKPSQRATRSTTRR